MKQRDFVAEATKALEKGLRPGTADSDINVLDTQILIGMSVLSGLLFEIKRLRLMAGAVSEGQSHREIKEGIKHGTSV